MRVLRRGVAVLALRSVAGIALLIWELPSRLAGRSTRLMENSFRHRQKRQKFPDEVADAHSSR